MRLPPTLAPVTVYEFLCSAASGELLLEERIELECIGDQSTMRQAWPKLKRVTRSVIRDAYLKEVNG
jgi:hypothetical protein